MSETCFAWERLLSAVNWSLSNLRTVIGVLMRKQYCAILNNYVIGSDLSPTGFWTCAVQILHATISLPIMWEMK